MTFIPCRPRSLPIGKSAAIREASARINPANHLEHRAIARTPIGRVGGRKRLAVVIGKRWPAKGRVLSVQFLDSPPAALRKRIVLHMNSWSKSTSMSFRETRGTGEVRIARVTSPPEDAGFWSYIGTEILLAEEDEATMNLEGFTMKTSEKEFRRVVRHEAGHTLGFEHEHMRSGLVKRIDRAKAYRYFDLEFGWPKDMVDEQVLTPLKNRSLMGTAESDPHSIMCYQLPGSITKDGRPIVGGVDINRKDAAFAGSVYPKRL